MDRRDGRQSHQSEITFCHCHLDRSILFRAAEEDAEWRDLAFPGVAPENETPAHSAGTAQPAEGCCGECFLEGRLQPRRLPSQFPKIRMRLGPATQAASVRGFLFCLLSPLGRDERLSPTAPLLRRAGCATFAEARLPIRDHATTSRQPLQMSATLSRYKSKMGGGRNARATSSR